ncbi:MAG: lysostaphin resistance A-like protein [Dehalococcoidia bacterium]
MVEAVALAAGLVAYNNLFNLLPQRARDRLYVPLHLGLTLLLLAWARYVVGLDLEALGLGAGEAGASALRQAQASALWGLGIAVALVASLFLLVAFPRLLPRRLEDPRLRGVTTGEVVYRALVRIPIGTALFEEVAFRSVLYGLMLERWDAATALWGSSLAFALWHVMPTREVVGKVGMARGPLLLALALVGGVAATYLGGILLGLLRQETGSVAGCVVAHAVINSLALVAARWRSVRQGAG